PPRPPATGKPGTPRRWARRSSLIARGTAASRRGPVALLELLAAPARARIVASDLLRLAAGGPARLRSRGRRPTGREVDALPRRLLLAALHVDHRRGQLGLEVDR